VESQHVFIDVCCMNVWAIAPEIVAHLGMFINHGTANVNPSRFWSAKGPLLLFISVRKISMGEENL